MTPSREIFNEHGEPMGKEVQERAEEDARVRFVEQSKADQEPLNEFLEQVDFGVLQNVFEDRLRALDVDTDDLNLLGPDHIFQPEGPLAAYESPLGQYFPAENLIAIDRDALENYYEDEHFKSGILKTLCHEEVHALSRVECEIFDYTVYSADDAILRKPYSSKRRQDVGYQRVGQTETGQVHSFYRLLNEGITEKLARELMEEYVSRTSIVSMDQLEKYREKRMLKHRENISEYQVAINFLNFLMRVVSRETGVSEDIVWGALVKGMFEGENLEDPELARAFEESFGAGFLKKIKHANIQDMEDLMSSLISGKKVEQRKGVVKKLVEKLNL